jgi:Flp pilus assembly pilin Flp
MVEYALLLAHNSVGLMGGISGSVMSWSSRLDSHFLGYAIAGIILLQVASWAFTSKRRY